MYEVKVTIQGTVPIKFNKMSEEDIELMDKGQRRKKDHAKELVKWKAKIPQDSKGYFIDSPMIRASVINGLVSPVPLVSNKIKMNKPRAKATIFVSPFNCYIDGKPDKEPDVTVTQNKNAIGNPSVVVRRPIIREWKVTFDLQVMDDYLTEEVLREGVERAGRSHGIGSHRPDFGRFEIVGWQKL